MIKFYTKNHFTAHLTSSVHQLTSIKPLKEVSKDIQKQLDQNSPVK